MKPKSISGIAYYVQDTAKSAAFYESLGFRPGKAENGVVTVYLNWFWIELRPLEEALDNTSTGDRTYISVDDVDECYAEATAKGFRACGEPSDVLGRREFTVCDPDGYQLVFFQKK